MILFVTFSIAIGFLVKLVDLSIDDDLKMKKTEYILGFVYGVLIFYLVYLFPQMLSFATAVVIALMLTKKIDAVPHMVGVGVYLLLIFLFNVLTFNMVHLVIFTFSALIDEVGNDIKDRKGSDKLFYKLIGSRIFLELTSLIASVITGNWYFFVGILSFDIAYITTEKIAKRYIL